MGERIVKCPRCGAPYRGPPIGSWVNSVKCEYCGGIIVISKTTRNLSTEPQVTQKIFDPLGFRDYLARKGVRNFDPISGVLIIGTSQFMIDEQGIVSGGPETIRKRIEKWVSEYMGVTS